MSYAVIDEMVGRRTPDPYCYRLYGFLDQRQVSRNTTGLTAYGVAKAIGWKRETVIAHLKHLAKLDLVGPLEDTTIAVRTNAVRHRVPADRNVRQMAPPDGRSGWWVAPKAGAGQGMKNVRQTDGSEPQIDMGTTSSDSRDALVEPPCSEGRHDERSSRVTVADPKPRAWSDCKCGRLLLTATDHQAGVCVFCRDEQVAVS